MVGWPEAPEGPCCDTISAVAVGAPVGHGMVVEWVVDVEVVVELGDALGTVGVAGDVGAPLPFTVATVVVSGLVELSAEPPPVTGRELARHPKRLLM